MWQEEMRVCQRLGPYHPANYAYMLSPIVTPGRTSLDWMFACYVILGWGSDVTFGRLTYIDFAPVWLYQQAV